MVNTIRREFLQNKKYYFFVLFLLLLLLLLLPNRIVRRVSDNTAKRWQFELVVKKNCRTKDRKNL